MITGRDIVCIASIEWDFLWQGHQEIAARCARAGNRVLYVENTGVRSPGLADAGRVASRLRHWIEAAPTGGVRQVAPNLHVCAPLVLPPFGPRWRRRLNHRLFLPAVRRAVRGLKMRDVLLWTYLPTDTAADLMRLLRTPRSASIYYCIADFAQLTPYLDQLRRSEADVLKLSDVVFAQGAELAAHCARWNSNVHIFPFGVNLDAFGEKQQRDRAAPEVLRGVPRPVIGYVGGLHRHVDFELIAAMARARPQWSWVFVGPLQGPVDPLPELRNVHLLGQQPHAEIVRYIREFDVGIVPYVSSSYTATVVPTKINEYLAVGKPVVATELPPVREFNDKYQVLWTAPTQPAAFLEAIEQALLPPTDPLTLQRRLDVASLGDWEPRLEAMSQCIEDVLRRKPPVTRRAAARL